MRRFAALPLLACLGACNLTPAQQAQLTETLAVACNVDGALVPVAQPVIASLGRNAEKAANVDTLLVHPAVVAACAALKGTPVSATPTALPVTTASPATAN